MPPIIQASIEIIQLLEKLFADWVSWGKNRDFYNHTLLPELLVDPSKGSIREKTILIKIKNIASPEELQYLKEIADQLEMQKQRIQKASNLLDHFFDKNDFSGAEAYISTNLHPAIQSLYEQKKITAIIRILRPINLYLNQHDFHSAEREFLSIDPQIKEYILQDYLCLVDSHQKLFIQDTISKIETCCQLYNFCEVESLYTKISLWVSREVIEHTIQDALGKQEEEIKKQQKIMEEFATKEKEEEERLLEIEANKIAELKIIAQKRSTNIREYCLQNRILNLVHFTRIQNLYNILQNGIINRNSLSQLLDHNHPIFNDEMRLDRHPEAICLSISFPNYQMFYRYNLEDQNQWVVLELDSSILWELDCAFCQENAASENMKHIPLEKRKEYESLTEMFGDFHSISRKELDIPSSYPTHPQAEVLVFNNVHPKYFKSVHFRSQDSFTKWQTVNGKPSNVSVVMSTRYFLARKDCSKWKKNYPIFDTPEVSCFDEELLF